MSSFQTTSPPPSIIYWNSILHSRPTFHSQSTVECLAQTIHPISEGFMSILKSTCPPHLYHCPQNTHRKTNKQANIQNFGYSAGMLSLRKCKQDGKSHSCTLQTTSFDTVLMFTTLSYMVSICLMINLITCQ